ncbi:MAG TPA: PIG-L family deacetylase [Candidatus Nitrosocosmicus sp.]|nr:PIG-L family deacetylase [Candidatus Nitrosocosmicus sp.]
MSKIVCVFAHPDDEAFGPGGTIATYAKNHNVYLICATRGEQGNNDADANSELAHIREKELRESAKILGIQNVYFMDFHDGTLSNNMYHQIADGIEQIISPIQPEILLTYEQHGISGHLDHIAISMITTYVYKKLTFVKKLYYYCINKNITPPVEDYFIYFPEGYSEKEITTQINIEQVWDTKVQSMLAHRSQKSDAERILERSKNKPRIDHFILAMHRLDNLKLPETDLLNGF